MIASWNFESMRREVLLNYPAQQYILGSNECFIIHTEPAEFCEQLCVIDFGTAIACTQQPVIPCLATRESMWFR